jgi:hypothetical protein
MAVVFGECGCKCLSAPGNTAAGVSVCGGAPGGGCHFSGRFIFARSVFDA